MKFLWQAFRCAALTLLIKNTYVILNYTGTLRWLAWEHSEVGLGYWSGSRALFFLSVQASLYKRPIAIEPISLSAGISIGGKYLKLLKKQSVWLPWKLFRQKMLISWTLGDDLFQSISQKEIDRWHKTRNVSCQSKLMDRNNLWFENNLQSQTSNLNVD